MVMSHLILPRRRAWSCVFSQKKGQGSGLQAVQAPGGDAGFSFKYVSYFLVLAVSL